MRGEGDAEQVRTGDTRVDAVLASLDGLDDRPVSEHAVVFEQAHDAAAGGARARPRVGLSVVEPRPEG